MFKYLNIVLLGLILAGLVSCSKDEIKKKIEKKIETEATDEEADSSVMSPQEIFSDALTNNILEGGDEDLQVYLEETIYPLAAKSNKVTIDKISSSLYLLQYEEGGSNKNILIQKFYNPVKDEIFFEKRDVQNDAIKQFIK